MAHKGTAPTGYEHSLVVALRGFQANYDNLADFTIICQNEQEFKSHKLLLAVRSKYFEALFRQEPLKTSVKLDYEGKIISTLLGSLVSIKHDDFDQLSLEELLQMLEVVDYLQMTDCLIEAEIVLSKKYVNLGNIYDILEFTECFLQNLSGLKNHCCAFVIENWLEIDLKRISKTWIKTIISQPSCHIKDRHGRLMSILATNVKFAESLHLVYPEENWFSKKSLQKINHGLNELKKSREAGNVMSDIRPSFTTSDEVSESVGINDEMLNILREKYNMSESDMDTDEDPSRRGIEGIIQEGDVVLLHSYKAFDKPKFTQINFVNFNFINQMRSMLGNKYKVLPKFIAKNDPEVVALPSPDGSQNGQWYFPTSVITKIASKNYLDNYGANFFDTGPYGSASDVIQRQQGFGWFVKGPFRKIGIKSRIWAGDTRIIQGLKFELVDGTVEAYGMDVTDNANVDELVVPEGQHIKDVILRSGWYIDQIGFRTNEHVQLGPIGGGGGDMRNVPPRVFIKKQVKQYYLRAIEGKTFYSENDGIPHIAKLKFHFIVISDPEDKKSWKRRLPYDHSDESNFSIPSDEEDYSSDATTDPEDIHSDSD